MSWSTIMPLLLIGQAVPQPALALAPPSAQPCSGSERHQLDFWIGDWDVFPATAPTTLVAHSRIESVAGGCAIRETWMPLRGAGGGSLSAYVPELKRWRQTWVDSAGSWVEFSGALAVDRLVIEGIWPQPGKPHQITRMTYRHLPDGSVEQRGETSDDSGKSWQSGFDFIYRVRAVSAPN